MNGDDGVLPIDRTNDSGLINGTNLVNECGAFFVILNLMLQINMEIPLNGGLLRCPQ
jgi:hypothetical protein